MNHESPLILEDLLSSAVDGLKTIGDARSIAVLITGIAKLTPLDSDFGITYWRLLISLPSSLYFAMNDDERSSSEETINRVVEPFFGNLNSDALGSVKIVPAVSSAEDGWRERALAFVKGEGVTNQGRVRSDNIASKKDQGLLYASNLLASVPVPDVVLCQTSFTPT